MEWFDAFISPLGFLANVALAGALVGLAFRYVVRR
jgi:hypothetical protein